MLIYPAIDLFGGQAVRLYQGDYQKMTVYSDDPRKIADDFVSCGVSRIHLVDLEGAKTGGTPNRDTILAIKSLSGLFCQVGGGIRSMETIDAYVSHGVDRVILGTTAVTEPGFVEKAVKEYGEKIAVGVDIKEGRVAIKGWTETSPLSALDFCLRMQEIGVGALICTDISRDGAMEGTNHGLYRDLMERLTVPLIASGGVSAMEDVLRLKEAGLHGAIIGKAYYTGAIDLQEAVKRAT